MRPTYKNYKQPRRINAVSILLVLAVVFFGYVGFCLWPVWSLRIAVKDELLDALPKLYRLNLQSNEAVARPSIEKLRKDLTESLRKAGVEDKRLELIVKRDKKMVSLEARFTVTASFHYLRDKKWDFQCAPRVETDAAHIEW